MTKYALGLRLGPDPLRYNFDVYKPTLVQRAMSLIAPKSSYSHKWAFPAVYDQGEFGTCVGQGNAAVRAMYLFKRLGKHVDVSRSAIFSQAKHAFEPNDIADDGLSVSDGILVEENFGYVLEAARPYPRNGDLADLLAPVDPHLWIKDDLYKDFVRVKNDVASMKMALRHNGPMIAGMSWSNDFFQIGADGMLPENPAPGKSAGGHCVVVVGYDDSRQAFEIRNSWSSSWGNAGYAYMPYSIINTVYWFSDLFTAVC